MIFWHESSATEPGGTTRDGRAHEPGAANIPAMPVAGAAPLVGVPQAGWGQRGGSCDYGADRSALSGPALLRLAPDGGVAGKGHHVNRKRVQRLMRLLGLTAIYQRPNTSKPAAAHNPYLLRGLTIERVNQVWCSDITYIPM